MVFKMIFFTEKDWSSETLWNFDDIAPFIQAHLFKVYLALCCTLMASAFGVHCHVYCNTGGIITTFGFIGSMGWLFLTSPWKEKRRVFLLMFAALCGGASIGPLLELVKIDPGKIITAFVGSAIGFGSFSGAAMSSQNRAYLYLLGLFSSEVLNLFWLLHASTFFGGYSALFMVDCLIMCLNLIHGLYKYHAKLYMYLYFELLLSYLVFNSQGIIVQARCGDVYYVHHALTFFTDFPAVVIGLIRKKKKLPVPPSEERKRRRGGRSRL